jgi:hypothetical protein
VPILAVTLKIPSISEMAWLRHLRNRSVDGRSGSTDNEPTFGGGFMKRSPRPRKTVSLSDSVHQQLNSYALAASAAGVTLLALSQPSDAKIVYTQTHVVIGTNHIYELDLNHDGLADFKINNHSFFTDTVVATLSALPAQANNRVVGAQRQIGSPYYAYALTHGGAIGPKQPFSGGWMAWSDGANRAGRWVNVRGRYLGLKFRIKGKIHYGWARLNVTVGNSRITATLTGYAYETIAGKTIIAGATKGPDGGEPTASFNMHTPEPATLGMLAVGAPRLASRRREDSVFATSKPN